MFLHQEKIKFEKGSTNKCYSTLTPLIQCFNTVISNKPVLDGQFYLLIHLFYLSSFLLLSHLQTALSYCIKGCCHFIFVQSNYRKQPLSGCLSEYLENRSSWQVYCWVPSAVSNLVQFEHATRSILISEQARFDRALLQFFPIAVNDSVPCGWEKGFEVMG